MKKGGNVIIVVDWRSEWVVSKIGLSFQWL